MKLRKIGLVTLLTFAILSIGVVALASIPDSQGNVQTCYKNNNPAKGAMIAIDSTALCPSGYTALNLAGYQAQDNTGPGGSITLDGTLQQFDAECSNPNVDPGTVAGWAAQDIAFFNGLDVVNINTGERVADPNLHYGVQVLGLGRPTAFRITVQGTSGNEVIAQLTCVRGFVPLN